MRTSCSLMQMCNCTSTTKTEKEFNGLVMLVFHIPYLFALVTIFVFLIKKDAPKGASFSRFLFF